MGSSWLLRVVSVCSLAWVLVAPGCKDGGGDSANGSGGTSAGGTAGSDSGIGGAAGGDASGDSSTLLPMPGADPNAATRLASALSEPCSAETTLAAIEALARSGIETHDDASAALVMEVIPPAFGLHVARTQARGMACEIAGKGGTVGSVIDAMVGPLPLPDGGTLPFSSLLGAYVAAEGRFGPELARELMGNPKAEDYANLAYPSLVIAMFVRDVLVPALANAPAAKVVDGSMQRIGLDPCGALADFLDDLPGAVANAISSVDPDDGGFWSKVMSVAGAVAGAVTYATVSAVKALIKDLPFSKALQAAGLAASAAMDLRAMFSQWTVTIVQAPGSIHKTVDGPPNTGQMVASISGPDGGFEWPPQIQSCAELFGVSLPNPNSAEGSSVVWTQLAGFESPAHKTAADAVVTGSQAKLTFQTVTETAAAHSSGQPEQSTPATVKADIALPGLKDLAHGLSGLMNAPGLQTAVDAGAEQAAQLTGPSGTGGGKVTFHEEPTATIDLTIADGGGFFHLHIVSCTGTQGPYNGTADVGADPAGSSPATLSMPNGTGNLSVNIPLSGTCSGNYDVNASATLGGTAPSPTVTFTGAVTGFIVCPVGGGPLSAPISGTYPIQLGPAPECP